MLSCLFFAIRSVVRSIMQMIRFRCAILFFIRNLSCFDVIFVVKWKRNLVFFSNFFFVRDSLDDINIFQQQFTCFVKNFKQWTRALRTWSIRFTLVGQLSINWTGKSLEYGRHSVTAYLRVAECWLDSMFHTQRMQVTVAGNGMSPFSFINILNFIKVRRMLVREWKSYPCVCVCQRLRWFTCFSFRCTYSVESVSMKN